MFALLVPLIARAAPPAAPAAPREETPTAVLAEGLHLETPGDVVGRNFRPADLLAFGQRTDEAALESLARLHPRHRLEVTFRYTLSPDKPHDVEVAIEPDELGEADIAAIRAALLKVPTARSATDPVSFTRRYAVRGSAEEAGQDEGPPVWGRSVPDAASETAAAAALAEIAAGGPFGHFGKVLVVGPSLYTALLRKDPQLKGVGVPFKIMVSGQERMRMVDGRLFRGDEVASFLKADPVRALAAKLAAGRARPATEAERGAFFSLISFDIAGMPVPVVQQGKDALLVDFVQQSVLWLEIVSAGR